MLPCEMFSLFNASIGALGLFIGFKKKLTGHVEVKPQNFLFNDPLMFYSVKVNDLLETGTRQTRTYGV